MNTAPIQRREPVAFTPGSLGDDPVAHHWLRQVTWRLRREVCWLWRERRLQGDASDSPKTSGALPMFADRALAALDLARYADDKRAFFADDITARYLSERIAGPAPPETGIARGSFGWAVCELGLAPVERFVLAMALLPAVDSAAGSVIATCLNDPTRVEPTLTLAQRLWDEPDEVLRCFDPAHPLLSHGLLALPSGPVVWQAALTVAPMVARALLFTGGELPVSLLAVNPLAPRAGSAAASLEGDTVASPISLTMMRVVPVVGAAGSPLAEVAAALAAARGYRLVRPSRALGREHLPAVLTIAWLRGCAVYLPVELLIDPAEAGGAAGHEGQGKALPLPTLPVHVFVGMRDRSEMRGSGAEVQPSIQVPPITHAERVECWRRALPSLAQSPLLGDIAQRFRLERAAIARIGSELVALGRAPTPSELRAAARTDVDLGSLAQTVQPRFELDELMLPALQTGQIAEIVIAMSNLARVHHEWGTARPWSEGGLAALFAGPPGTGKTMAAEALARALGLPLYRIDLSQVVNKYIGETEKNLRRLFDAADVADMMLFFDEADSLFGKRTEVKDAHDRYANLEVSYLLERMERFRGLAILATNRRKDLDIAFVRRLRFVIEFPLPGIEERRRIWRSVIPPGVDASALDFEFLAQHFPLAGGHIRAIVFQACLQSATEGAARRLEMRAIVRAVDREYDKLDRPINLDPFGKYAPLVVAARSGR
jgi:hypothetical protein